MTHARLEWTSVPRWPSPELPAAASYLVCWFGNAASSRVRELLSGADPGSPVRMAGFAAQWDATVEAELRRLIGACHTGVRIILAGPESMVMRSMAVARQLGASDEELVPVAIEAPGTAEGITARGAGEYITGITERRVFCADCRRSFDAVAAIGGRTRCPGCAAALIVDSRFSRPHAAYFGWPAGLDLHQ
jgi:dimethylamine monooxygenase subunit C